MTDSFEPLASADGSTPCGGLPQTSTPTSMNDNPNEEISALITTSDTSREEIERAALVVSSRGALIKNRHGRTAPDNRLGCNLTKMTVTSDLAQLHFPADECCDMGGAITLATRACSTITTIQTWSGEKQDTRYQKTGDEWEGSRAA